MTPSVPAVVAGRSKVGLAIVRALAVRGVACKGSAVASLSDPMPALSPLQAGLGGALKQRRPAAQGGIAQA
ncbi:MAG TPA: hypothetical protein VG994_12510 [Steroidobacteraceae bacterium]|nr:hypothetical protein [Steroidobacteraceae bacterium]